MHFYIFSTGFTEEPRCKIMYGPTVRIGNWVEDLELEKERIASFIEKREKGQLLVQHTRRLFQNVLRETRLSKNDDGFVKFGNCVQLKAPFMPNSPLTGSPSKGDQETDRGVVVAGTVHDKHITDISNLTNDCRLVASPILAPCTRNSFLIEPTNGSNRNGENLLFGQDFALQIVDFSSEALYVRSEKPPIDGSFGPLDHDPVRLSNQKDRYATWRVLHWDKDRRLESEGTPIPPFRRVVLRHSMSGLDLAVEGTVWWTTIFGNECGLSVHTYLDLARRETAECIWMFVTDDSHESSSSVACY